MSVEVVLGDLENGLCGYYDHTTETVYINRALSMKERRCTLVHEEIHAEQRHEPVDSLAEHTAREVTVEREAARRLISFPALIWAWTRHAACMPMADGLEVDTQTLFARILAMTPAEQLIFDVCALRCIGVRSEVALSAGDVPALLNVPSMWDERIIDAVDVAVSSSWDGPADGWDGVRGTAEGRDVREREQVA